MHDFNARPRKEGGQRVSSVDDARLPGRPSPRFIYAHNPASWDFDAEYGFLPRVQKIPLRVGVNGHRPGPNGHLPVLTGLRAKGWIPLDEGGPVKRTGDGGEIEDDTGYLYRWEGTKGAIYQDCWATPTLVGAGRTARVDWSTQYDRAGFRAWRVMLRDSGTVPPITAGVAAGLVKIQERRAARRLNEGHDGNPHVQAHVKAEHATLAAMQAEAVQKGARIKGAPMPPKKRGPGRPKKVAPNA